MKTDRVLYSFLCCFLVIYKSSHAQKSTNHGWISNRPMESYRILESSMQIKRWQATRHEARAICCYPAKKTNKGIEFRPEKKKWCFRQLFKRKTKILHEHVQYRLHRSSLFVRTCRIGKTLLLTSKRRITHHFVLVGTNRTHGLWSHVIACTWQHEASQEEAKKFSIVALLHCCCWSQASRPASPVHVNQEAFSQKSAPVASSRGERPPQSSASDSSSLSLPPTARQIFSVICRRQEKVSSQVEASDRQLRMI